MEKSEITQKLQNSRLKTVRKLLNDQDDSILKKPEVVLNAIKTKYNNLNSIRAHLTAVMAYLRDTKQYDKGIANKYQDINRKLREELYTNTLANNLKSDRFIEWDQLIKYRDELANTADTKSSYGDYLLLSLYTYLPPARADYAKIRIQKTNIKGDDTVYINSKKPKIIIKKYKTSKNREPITHIIPEKLNEIIHTYINKYLNDNPKWLFNMTRSNLSGRISRILYPMFGKTSINDIRKSYISSIYNNLSKYTNQDLENIAYKMGNSIEEAMKTYRKADANKE